MCPFVLHALDLDYGVGSTQENQLIILLDHPINPSQSWFSNF